MIAVNTLIIATILITFADGLPTIKLQDPSLLEPIHVFDLVVRVVLIVAAWISLAAWMVLLLWKMINTWFRLCAEINKKHSREFIV